MCGILGFVTNKPSQTNFNLFRRLLWASQSRGKDATGIAIIEKGGITIHKMPIPASQYVTEQLDSHMESIAKAHIVVGHVRAATMGKPDNNNNNHPIHSENWVMVHNGTVHNLDRITGYKYMGEVDSEVLLSYIETKGLTEGLEYAGAGSAAVAILNRRELNSLYLFEHSGNIAVGYDELSESLFFASTKSILEDALKNKLLLFSTFKLETLPSDTLFKVTLPLDMHVEKKIEPKKISYVYNQDYYNTGYLGYFGANRPLGGSSYSGVSKISKGPSNKEKPSPPKDVGLTAEEWGYAWSKDDSCWILASRAELYAKNLKNLETEVYHMGRQSNDYLNWTKCEQGKGYLSSDLTLFKVFNRDGKEHMIMTVETAIQLGYLAFVPGIYKSVIGTCTLDCFLDDGDEIVGWRIWSISSVDGKDKTIPGKPNGKYIAASRTIEVSGVECLLVCGKSKYGNAVIYFEVTDVGDLLEVVDNFISAERAKKGTQSKTNPLAAQNCVNYDPIVLGKKKYLNCRYCRLGLQKKCTGPENKAEAKTSASKTEEDDAKDCMYHSEGTCLLDSERSSTVKRCYRYGCKDFEMAASTREADDALVRTILG